MDHTIVHFEIPANDPERAATFYRELFGWSITKWTAEGAPDYWMVSTVPTDGKGMPLRPGVNGGLLQRQHAEHSPVNYVSVENVEEYAQKAKRLGAEEVMPKTPVKGMGWFAMLRDPEDNVFAIWQSDEKAA
jgi:predicted enzyme related to lactoylglutathione lyase